MSTLTLELPAEYSYVLAVAPMALAVNMYHFFLTAGARKKSGLKYPIPYATQEQAEKDPNAFHFNCCQRAHANYTESLTPFLGSLFIAGLAYPTASAGLGAAWAAGRVLYAAGYTSSGPRGRLAGSGISNLSSLALLGMAFVSGFKLVKAAGLA